MINTARLVTCRENRTQMFVAAYQVSPNFEPRGGTLSRIQSFEAHEPAVVLCRGESADRTRDTQGDPPKRGHS